MRTLRLERRGAVALVTLARPDRLNAFTREMGEEFVAALDITDADDDVRAVVVTGEGRCFCAGADITDGVETFRGPNAEPSEDGGLLTLRLLESLKPVVAACNGPAIGIGATMQLAMDLRIAEPGASYGFIFTRLGIAPEAASAWFLPKIVGVPTALDWCLGGRTVGAEEALRAGLVSAIAENVVTAAIDQANRLVTGTAPVSVALTRQLIWSQAGAASPLSTHELDELVMNNRSRSADLAAGFAAAKERRAPVFVDRVSRDMPDFWPWYDKAGQATPKPSE